MTRPIVAASLCAFVLASNSRIGAHAAAAASAGAVSTAPASASLALPAHLQSLEALMEGLHVASERFAETVRSYTTVLKYAGSVHGRARYRRRRISTSSSGVGIAGVDPPEAELFRDATSTPTFISIGSIEYEFAPERCDRGRPWTRQALGAASLPGYPFEPYPGEPSGPGSGPYGGLINLLSRARSLREGGPATVQGQATSAFTATVEVPVAYLGPSPNGRVKQYLAERLEVYITPSGLPLRTVLSYKYGPIHLTTTSTVLAVNLPKPLGITPPPASQTRPFSQEPSCGPRSTK